MSIEVVSVNVSVEKGTVKHPVSEITIGKTGIDGDAHAGDWHRQVSMLSRESIRRFAETTGRDTSPGEFAENITVSGIDLATVSLLDRFRIGSVELEVSQIGKKCHGEGCAIYREVGQCAMPREGIFCRVISGGTVRPGDAVEYRARTLSVKVITLSDRASRGEYQDRSGPRIRELIESFLNGTGWNPKIDTLVMPDDAEALRSELVSARDDGSDIVFTTGGTGVGPRDFTPEVVTEVCDKSIPGIMDFIRLKYGAEKPNALLSRSVAGVAGRTLVYTLPGSVRAVEEYMTEITKTLEHLIYTLRGLDTHNGS